MTGPNGNTIIQDGLALAWAGHGWAVYAGGQPLTDPAPYEQARAAFRAARDGAERLARLLG